MSDKLVSDIEGLALTILVLSGILAFVMKRMRMTRPELAIGLPVVVGLGLRLLAIAGINSTGVSSQLRGGDESTFLSYAHAIAQTPLAAASSRTAPTSCRRSCSRPRSSCSTSSPTALRVTQVGISMLGILLTDRRDL